MDSGGGGHFSNDNPFPGMTLGEGLNNYVLQATGTLTITASQAGYYTFGVNSDDGFTLTISGASFSNGVNTTTCSGSTMACDKLQAATDTLGTTYLAAGSYPVTLVYFENQDKPAEMEFYAAKESSSTGVTSFDPNSILVGADFRHHRRRRRQHHHDSPAGHEHVRREPASPLSTPSRRTSPRP